MNKIPPQNTDAEQAVLGACLLGRESVSSALEFVRAADFYREEHRLIFACLQSMAERGIPCDLVTLADELTLRGELEKVGGIAYIASLPDTVPSAASVSYYSQIVAEKSLIRSLIHTGELISSEGYSGSHSGGELLEIAEKSIFELGENQPQQGLFKASDLVVEVFEQLNSLRPDQGVTGVPTFRDLDRYLSGLQKGDLILLAARPGMGKTSMAINIAQRAAINHGCTVAIFSLEMPKEQLLQRMLCSQAEVNLGKARSGMINDQERQKLSASLDPLYKTEIYISDSPGITVMEMRRRCRRLKLEQKRLDLVVIDYLQLMQGTSRRAENRQLEIAEISRSLKAMAKELEVPVLALSQLSRAAERGSEAPHLSHLRESGALEQDADVVIFLNPKKEKEDEEAQNDLLDVIVAKNRNGPPGAIQLVFIRQYTTFKDYVQEWEAEQ